MIEPQALGALANAHGLLLQLIENLPGRDCNRRFDKDLPSAGWLLGRSVFVELRLLRSLLMADDDLAGRVQHLFNSDHPPSEDADSQLPPREHLLKWAGEIFDQHLTWLANPGHIPAHPLLEGSWLVWYLAQRHALNYERLLAVVTARSAQREGGEHRATRVLEARPPQDDSVRIEQGHYRVGAREGAVMANELPAQVVELHAFRIARRPVSNREYLAFMQDAGYRDSGWWDTEGRQWRESISAIAPWHWRQDDAGHWYCIGTNGAMDLHPDEPVAGLGAHESRAFAAWAAARGNGLSGAVPQHEYQWEVAARLGEIEQHGRSWEWCANAFHTYPGYQAPPDPLLEPCPIDSGALVLRGGCLHTQPSLRRSTFRFCAAPGQRSLFAGTRLVMPPGKAAWE
ncbi:MAG: SUMF1/EgtB/PvdO family nonheme iron enzyme [Sedimenticolaceae bacterium]